MLCLANKHKQKTFSCCVQYSKRSWARGDCGLAHYNGSSVLGLGPTPRISLAATFEYFPRRNFD